MHEMEEWSWMGDLILALKGGTRTEIGEGAPEDEIRKLENELGLSFPATFVQFLREFDGGQFKFVRMHRITENGAGVLDFRELLEQSCEWIPEVEDNKLLPFGDDYAGNTYCFNLEKRVGDEYEIVQWNHEHSDRPPKHIADSFPEFVEKEFFYY
jgi:cell wall assembly regulator SMI1